MKKLLVFDIILGQQCRLKFQALQLYRSCFPVHSAPSWPTKKPNRRIVLVTWHRCIIHRARHKNSTFHSGHFPAAVWSSTINVWLLIQKKQQVLTALSWVEGGCPRCSGASTVISQPLDGETLPWLAIPATKPWAPTQGHLGTRHTMIKVERGKKKGGLDLSKSFTVVIQPLSTRLIKPNFC